jgi:hypothetical protein
MRSTCLVLLAVLLLGCGPEPAPTVVPPDTSGVVATVVASHKMTRTAEAARVPTAAPTDTAMPTATAVPTNTPTPTPPPIAQLEGQVLDVGSGQPLAGAQVAAGERQTTTDSEGRFLFVDLAPGPYTILVTSVDHDPVLSGIVDLRAGEQVVVDTALPAAGTGEYPRDPMASNQIDPAGAPTAQEAERLARLQGLQGEVVSVREVMLEGEYLVNYKKGDAIRAAMATLHHPAWELVDEAGQAWYVIRVCGNLAVVRAPQVQVPAECVATPHPVVMVGDRPLSAYACPSETCAVVAELATGWHGVTLACGPGCDWLQVQCPGVTGGCWVRREWLETWGDLAELEVVSPWTGPGRIVFVSYRDNNLGELYLMDGDGKNQRRLTNTPNIQEWHPSWSPDGSRIVFQCYRSGGPGFNVCLINADGSGYTQITNWEQERAGAQRPVWSPDGSQIAVSREMGTDAPTWIWVMNADGSNQRQLVEGRDPSWSPDGTRIAFERQVNGGSPQLFTVDLDGSNLRQLTELPDFIMYPTWSPDVRQIAFEVGMSYIAVIGADGGEPRTVVNKRSWNMSWSPDGTQLAIAPVQDGIWVVNLDGSGLHQIAQEGTQPSWRR